MPRDPITPDEDDDTMDAEVFEFMDSEPDTPPPASANQIVVHKDSWYDQAMAEPSPEPTSQDAKEKDARKKWKDSLWKWERGFREFTPPKELAKLGGKVHPNQWEEPDIKMLGERGKHSYFDHGFGLSAFNPPSPQADDDSEATEKRGVLAGYEPSFIVRENPEGIPTAGKSLIYIVVLKEEGGVSHGKLHFRIFDWLGTQIFDAGEDDLGDRGEEIKSIKKLKPTKEGTLTAEQTKQLLKWIEAIAGHSLTDKCQNFYEKVEEEHLKATLGHTSLLAPKLFDVHEAFEESVCENDRKILFTIPLRVIAIFTLVTVLLTVVAGVVPADGETGHFSLAFTLCALHLLGAIILGIYHWFSINPGYYEAQKSSMMRFGPFVMSVTEYNLEIYKRAHELLKSLKPKTNERVEDVEKRMASVMLGLQTAHEDMNEYKRLVAKSLFGPRRNAFWWRLFGSLVVLQLGFMALLVPFVLVWVSPQLPIWALIGSTVSSLGFLGFTVWLQRFFTRSKSVEIWRTELESHFKTWNFGVRANVEGRIRGTAKIISTWLYSHHWKPNNTTTGII